MFERINMEKLKQVIQCNNIPFERGDDEMWNKAFLTALRLYSKKKLLKMDLKLNISKPM